LKLPLAEMAADKAAAVAAEEKVLDATASGERLRQDKKNA
jgi:hypothetical protein